MHLLQKRDASLVEQRCLKCYKQVFKPGKAGDHDVITSKEALLIGEEILTRLHYIAKSSFSLQKFHCIHKKGE